MVEERCHLVWQCRSLTNENIRPAGRVPKPGCGRLNHMSTKTHDWYTGIKIQSSPCKHCGKRVRLESSGLGADGTCKMFQTKEEAIRYVEEKTEEEDWF